MDGPTKRLEGYLMIILKVAESTDKIKLSVLFYGDLSMVYFAGSGIWDLHIARENPGRYRSQGSDERKEARRGLLFHCAGLVFHIEYCAELNNRRVFARFSIAGK